MKILCPRCQAPVETKGTATVAVACASCGALIDIARQQAVGSAPSVSGANGQFPLEIGKTGTINTIPVTVIGWIRYQDALESLDPDEETTEWVEWHLASAKSSYWLEELPNGTAVLWQPTELTGLSAEKLVTDAFIHTPDGEAKILEAGVGRANGFQGEVAWMALKNERLHFADTAKINGFVYTIEWDHARPDELECYKGKILTQQTVLDAFKLTSLNPFQATGSGSSVQPPRTLRWIAASVPLFALVIIILDIYVIAFFGQGTAIFSQTVAFCGVERPGCVATSTIIGPFSLTHTHHAHRITVQSLSADLQHWHATEAILLDQNKKELSATESDFWEEEGYEDGEHWHESDREASHDFRLTEAGTYHLGLTDDATTTAANVAREPSIIRVTVLQDVINEWPLIIHAVLAVLLGIYFFQSNKTLTRWVQSSND